MITSEDLGLLSGQIADTQVNPLADVLTRLIVRLAENNVLTKEDAIDTVAASYDMLGGLPYDREVIEQAANQLGRMVHAIDTFIEPSRRLTDL